MKKLAFEFELSEEAFDLLASIDENTYLEYRDTEFETLEEFRSRPAKIKMSEPLYLVRNSSGTLKQAHELLELGFLNSDERAWHTTYRLSELGKQVKEFNNI